MKYINVQEMFNWSEIHSWRNNFLFKDYRVSLEGLQSIEPSIAKIYMAVSEVALYKFEGNGLWEKTPKIEGTIFLYQKKCEFCYGFLILNPSKSINEILPITKDTKIDDFYPTQGQPKLIYKNEVIY